MRFHPLEFPFQYHIISSTERLSRRLSQNKTGMPGTYLVKLILSALLHWLPCKVILQIFIIQIFQETKKRNKIKQNAVLINVKSQSGLSVAWSLQIYSAVAEKFCSALELYKLWRNIWHTNKPDHCICCYTKLLHPSSEFSHPQLWSNNSFTPGYFLEQISIFYKIECL